MTHYGQAKVRQPRVGTDGEGWVLNNEAVKEAAVRRDVDTPTGLSGTPRVREQPTSNDSMLHWPYGASSGL